MEFKTLSFIILIALSFTVIQCQMQNWIVPGNNGEKALCEGAVNSTANQTLQSAMKERELSCQVLCVYSDGRNQTLNSPENQQCSLILPIVKTGTCKNGTCDIFGRLFSG